MSRHWGTARPHAGEQGGRVEGVSACVPGQGGRAGGQAGRAARAMKGTRERGSSETRVQVEGLRAAGQRGVAGGGCEAVNGRRQVEGRGGTARLKWAAQASLQCTRFCEAAGGPAVGKAKRLAHATCRKQPSDHATSTVARRNAASQQGQRALQRGGHRGAAASDAVAQAPRSDGACAAAAAQGAQP